MNLRDLHYLVAVADRLNFSLAAEQCHVSQPTLSGQIKKLEDQLGVQIFERTNKHVMPTEIGEAIIQTARRMLREEQTIREIAESAHDPLAGKFRLGAFPTLSTYIFPELVSKMREAMPRLRLILIEDKTAALTEKLRRGELDAALLALPVHDDYFVSHKLFEDEFVLAVPAGHALAQHKSVNQKVLSEQKLLLLEEGHCLRDQALEVCDLHRIGEEDDVRATGLETLRQMVRAGTGITLLPHIAVNAGEEGIVHIPFDAPAPRRIIGLVWRKTIARREVVHGLCQLFQR